MASESNYSYAHAAQPKLSQLKGLQAHRTRAVIPGPLLVLINYEYSYSYATASAVGKTQQRGEAAAGGAGDAPCPMSCIKQW